MTGTPGAGSRMAFDPCSFLFDAARERNGETFEQFIGGRRAVVVQSMDGALHVLRANAVNYTKELWPFRQVMGASRLTEDGESWRRREALSQPFLARFDPAALTAAAHRRAGELVARLLDSGGTGRLDQFAIDVATIRILADALLGGRLSDDAEAFARDMHVMLDYASAYAFSAREARSETGRETMRDLTRARARMIGRLSGVRAVLPGDGGLLDALSAADGDSAADIVFEHELMMLFAAGSDTSAAALGWCCAMLAEHPAEQDAIRAELAGLPERAAADPATLLKLPGLRAFIEETMRLCPPIPLLARAAVAADAIDGVPVEPGGLVFVSVIGIHRDARHWPEPHAFSTSRHGPEGGRRARIIPFSTGPRICGGARFAMHEVTVVLGALARALRFAPSGLEPGPFQWRISMRRQLGHPVSVTAADGVRGHGASSVR